MSEGDKSERERERESTSSKPRPAQLNPSKQIERFQPQFIPSAIDKNIKKDPKRVLSTIENAMDQNADNSMPSVQQQEAAIKKKYGGIVPRKPPLISKDHERAYFDSADWALGKQGAPVEKPKGPLEALRPKLQPTPQQQVRSRRASYTASETEDGDNIAAE